MFIQPISSNKFVNNQNINFKLNFRFAKDSTGAIKNRSTTYFMRSDFPWDMGAVYFRDSVVRPFLEKYKGAKKIHFYDFGCSSGEGTISTILSFLKHMKPEEYELLFPIIAKDIDKENIKDAQNGLFCANNVEKVCLERMLTDESHCKFFDIDQNTMPGLCSKALGQAKYAVKFHKSILEKAKFSEGDILTEVDSMPRETSIIRCSNMWAYLPRTDQIFLLQKISDKFKGTNSHIIFGDYDNPYGNNQEFKLYCSSKGSFNDHGTVVHLGIQQNGYEPTEVHNVFKI